LENCFGNLNPHLHVSVSSPPDVAAIKVLAEGDDECFPWSIFQVHFGGITTYRHSYEWEDCRRGKGEEPRERSREENRVERVVQKGKGVFTKKEEEAANLLPGVEERLGNSVLSTSTTT
jgi:hypothetical protein